MVIDKVKEFAQSICLLYGFSFGAVDIRTSRSSKKKDSIDVVYHNVTDGRENNLKIRLVGPRDWKDKYPLMESGGGDDVLELIAVEAVLLSRSHPDWVPHPLYNDRGRHRHFHRVIGKVVDYRILDYVDFSNSKQCCAAAICLIFATPTTECPWDVPIEDMLRRAQTLLETHGRALWNESPLTVRAALLTGYMTRYVNGEDLDYLQKNGKNVASFVSFISQAAPDDVYESDDGFLNWTCLKDLTRKNKNLLEELHKNPLSLIEAERISSGLSKREIVKIVYATAHMEERDFGAGETVLKAIEIDKKGLFKASSHPEENVDLARKIKLALVEIEGKGFNYPEKRSIQFAFVFSALFGRNSMFQKEKNIPPLWASGRYTLFRFLEPYLSAGGTYINDIVLFCKFFESDSLERALSNAVVATLLANILNERYLVKFLAAAVRFHEGGNEAKCSRPRLSLAEWSSVLDMVEEDKDVFYEWAYYAVKN